MIAKSLVQILHYTHHYAISFVNGAKACFDTIIPFLCLMATEHLGMTKLATTGVLATIKGMHYFLSKTHVISLGFYTSSTAALIPVVHQGTAAAPCIWFSLCSILLQALHSHTTSFQATCPLNPHTFQYPRLAFVDVTDLWLASTHPSTSSLNTCHYYAKCATGVGISTFARCSTLALQILINSLAHMKRAHC